MRPLWEGHGFRRASYWVLIAAFLTLSIYAGEQAFGLQQTLDDKEAERAQRELQALLSLWERSTLNLVTAWILDIAETTDPSTVEARYRRSAPFFEAFYIWRPGPEGPKFQYPTPPIEEHIDTLMEDECLANAAQRSDASDPIAAAQAYEKCTNGDPQVSLLASSRAADLYLSAHRAKEALQALDKGPIPLMLPIDDAAEHGVSAYRVVVRRLQAADAELELGATDRQILLLSRTGREITEHDGRALEQLLPFIDYPILDDLRAAGADPQGDRIEEHAFDARRRLLGYLEVATRIATNEFPTSPDEGDVEPAPPTIDLSYDQYGRTYLLAYSAIASTGMMVAIQLDQLGLLGSLLDAARPNLRQQLVVVGAKGDVILAGSPTATDPIWFQIPFGTLLPDLRLAIRRGESIARVDALRFLATQLVPLGLAIALGSIALYTRILADRELNDLVARQQAFVARVTHELKTPLAGIRVMAETLLMGVGEDPAKRQDFLDRILGEADRLQVRIDEVLRAAGRTGMSARELLAMDELVQEVLDTWKPRLEHAGVELKTSLRPCPLTPIDRTLMADAVSNLIDNALKYRRTDRPSKLWVATRATRSRCLVDVSDNGLGVPAKDRKAIFQPFTRVEQPGRGKAGGHGLGLSFVLEAAKSHGGTVECREGIDGGARFILTIRRQAWKSW